MILPTTKCAMRKVFSFAHDAVCQIVNGNFNLILRIIDAGSPVARAATLKRLLHVSVSSYSRRHAIFELITRAHSARFGVRQFIVALPSGNSFPSLCKSILLFRRLVFNCFHFIVYHFELSLFNELLKINFIA